MKAEINSTAKVSVIMPAFNQEKYIAKEIESVLSQQAEFSYEILIGDDCSADRTADIAREYSEKFPDKIRVFAREKNLGPTRNGYELLVCARGEYIATCEGDDFWTDPYKLQKQVDFLDSNREYSACTHDMSVCDEDGKVVCDSPKIRWISRKREYSVREFHGIFLPGHPVSMLRRNYLLASGESFDIIYKADPMISDRTIALIWASKGNIYRMPERMASYRMVRSNSAKNVTSRIFVQNMGPNAIQHDLEYTLRLIELVQLPEKKVSVDYHLAELFASCIFYRLKNGNDVRMLKKRISASCRSKFYCHAMFPVILIRRLIEKADRNYRFMDEILMASIDK